jgi:hypothetical protein
MVGVYVRRPDLTADHTDARDTCLTGHATSHEGE